jgi:hypothetical protein
VQRILNGAVSASATQITGADASISSAIKSNSRWTLTLDKPVPYKAPNGAAVTAVADLGTKPSWWPDVLSWVA